LLLLALVALFLISEPLPAQNGARDGKPAAEPKTVEELARLIRPTIVVITASGRDGKQHGIGTGFLLKDGLIATNLHVIGEGRPITIQLADGATHPITAVHASDRSLDLALLKIDAKGLPALELGDSDALRDGQPVVALGHPRGLKYSVVSGVVSGRQKIDNQAMIQLAMPIEEGNSGGPLVDLHGRVQGVITLKSQVTANLGFAVPVNALKGLLSKPNPIPLARWVTIGTLNPDEWATVYEGRWRQRGGKIVVDGLGIGFGGRSLCLSKREVPELPYELGVSVRLLDESGAGGLVFHADGGEKHYGFYPTNGKLRLSRFEGPDVFSWKVLTEVKSEHYRRGEWNTLKVRVEKGRILCYLNDQLVIESTDAGLTSGKVGLAKFRESHVEFKHFQVAKKLPPALPSAELIARITKSLTKLPPRGKGDGGLADELTRNGRPGIDVLRERARELEAQAARLRELAVAVHHKSVLKELAEATQGDDGKIDLVHAALLIARLDNEELDVETYRKQVDRLAREIAAALPKEAGDKERLATLNKELFAERGFHGSRGDYYHRSNSYLNEVIDDREGIPITLSLLYLELGRRLGLNLEGVGLPGHFVVQHQPANSKPVLIDVYEGGKEMSLKEAARKVENITGKPLQAENLFPVSKRAILVRLLHNLANLAQRDQDLPGFLRYHDAILTVAPDSSDDRLTRSAARYQSGDREGAIADLDYLLKQDPPGLDREQVLKLRQLLGRQK
jgi:regulator of sirC expression with transglutaminase-like and TPR domain